MEMRQGRGDIPSYKAMTTGEASRERNKEGAKTKEGEASTSGAKWRAGLTSKCLPRAMNKPKFVIPNNRLEEYRSYMKDNALICKFVGFWPVEKDLFRWIQQRWKPKGHVEIKLGVKGFFTVIFSSLEDKERIFEGGPYFMNNARLFMRQWVDCYNPEKEKMLEAPIWIRLFGLPIEFWDPEILEGIGNVIRSFVKVVESTKRGRYTSYPRIYVYMNIT